MSNYRRGRAYEYRQMDKLREAGWPLVIRSAGSHSDFDIVAIDPDKKQIILKQCKSGKSKKQAIKQVEKQGLKEKYEGNYTVKVSID